MGTILINPVGSFVIGFFGTLTLAGGKYPVPEGARLFVMTGLCGGFTTFSTFALDAFRLVAARQWMAAVGYVVVSNVVGFAAVLAGYKAVLVV